MRQFLVRIPLSALLIALISTVAHAQAATPRDPMSIDEAEFKNCVSNPANDACAPIIAACRGSENPKCVEFRNNLIKQADVSTAAALNAGSPPLAGGALKVSGRTLPTAVATELDKCTPTNQCNNLYDFKKKAPVEYGQLQIWCRARLAFDFDVPRAFQPKSVKKACQAVRSDREDKLVGISSTDIQLLLEDADKAFYTCNGFGFTVPLFSLRRGLAEDRDGGGEARVRGPIESGVGAGYYWALDCHPEWTWGIQGYGFTEGLDPSGKFQVGLGAGVGLTAFKYFRFGLGVGYDLFRQSQAEDGTLLRNGLLIGKYAGRQSLTWHITFGLQSVESQTSEPEVSPAAGTGGQP